LANSDQATSRANRDVRVTARGRPCTQSRDPVVDRRRRDDSSTGHRDDAMPLGTVFSRVVLICLLGATGAGTAATGDDERSGRHPGPAKPSKPSRWSWRSPTGETSPTGRRRRSAPTAPASRTPSSRRRSGGKTSSRRSSRVCPFTSVGSGSTSPGSLREKTSP
jgi:hypothetical protein